MTGCSIVIVIALAGCGFTLTAGSSGDDVPDGERITLTDDTAADFAANAGLTDAEIATRGALEPAAFVLGGLHGRAFAGEHVIATSTYATVAAAVGPELGAAYRQVPAEYNATQTRPRGLGVNSASSYTVLFAGEILLPSGPVTLEVHGDDIVIVEISLDGGATFDHRVVSPNQVRTLALPVPASGWYPIRASFKQGGGSAFWRMSITPIAGMKVPVDGQRLRKRLTTDQGLIASAFANKVLLLPIGETTVATIDEDFGAEGPGHDLPTTITDRYAVRFAGQVRIDTADSYTFSADIGGEPADYYRIWIDGVLVAHVWPSLVDRPTVTLPLAPGWHDVLVDYAEDLDTARIELTMSGGGLPAGPIDPSRLRPAVAFGLTASFLGALSNPLVDATAAVAGVTPIELPLVVPGGGTIASVDYGFGMAEQRLSDLTVDLIDCKGANTLPPLATGVFYYYFAGDTRCAGHPVVPVSPWAWRVTDTVIGNDAGDNPIMWLPSLIATYWGGERMPFAPTFTFVSAPKPTPGASGFGAVEITADLRGALMTFEMRAGADPAQLAAASWIPVGNGEVPALIASEWVQYRIAISGDGWKLASVDKVALTYVVPAE